MFPAKATRHTQHGKLLGLVGVVISGSGALSLGQVLLVFSEVTQVAFSKEVYDDSRMFAAVLDCVNVRLLYCPSQFYYKGFLMRRKLAFSGICHRYFQKVE